jgi:hypothetical protein
VTAPRVLRLRRGEPIRARYLNALADSVDELRARVSRLEGGAGTQATDANPQGSNLSPDQLLDPTLDAASVTQGLNAGRVLSEIARLVTVVRVENPSDPAQYVDVERVEVITFGDNDGEKMTLIFDN